MKRPNTKANARNISARMDRIIFTIPSHIPIFASVLPASGERPALISLISFLPTIHAGIAAKSPQAMYDSMPSTNAMIAFELAPPPVFMELGATGGGGGLKLGGGGGGGKFPLPESVR